MCHHGPGPGPPIIGGIGVGGGGGPTTHGGLSAFHGPPPPPPPLCNPCSTNSNSFNSVPIPGPSRWGPRSTCPVHSPFRVRMPNGSVCSGHQDFIKLRVNATMVGSGTDYMVRN
ncbi:forkhead box protein L2-like [Sergentomyia squamirostris]